MDSFLSIFIRLAKLSYIYVHMMSLLRIAVLDTDTPVPNVYAERGLYSKIFEVLLRDAYSQTPGLPELEFEFSKYDCVIGELPSPDELLQIDGVIITGSGRITSFPTF